MSPRIFGLVLVHVFLGGLLLGTSISTRNQTDPQVFFSPTATRDPEKAVLAAIAGAKREIRIAMFSFTRRPLRQELVRAKERGVDVQVILDRKTAASKFSEWRDLKAAGIPVFFSLPPKGAKYPGLMHHKYAVFDQRLVLTGSFNWTGNAVGFNQENLITLDSSKLANQFLENWKNLPCNEEPPQPKKPKQEASLPGNGQGDEESQP